jgi:hypothetical protein
MATITPVFTVTPIVADSPTPLWQSPMPMASKNAIPTSPSNTAPRSRAKRVIVAIDWALRPLLIRMAGLSHKETAKTT